MIKITIGTAYKVAYNGIEGSFSHQMALLLFGSQADLRPAPNPVELEKGLIKGDYDIGIMPLVNKTARAVQPTLETLLKYRGPIHIVDSFGLPVDQRVGGLCRPEDVKFIVSHATAIDQCQDNLKRLFPGYIRVDEEDTAVAVKRLSEGEYDGKNNGPDVRNTAVIGSEIAFGLYKIPMFYEHNIADAGDENLTMFLMLKRRSAIPVNVTQSEEAIRILGLRSTS